MSNLYLIKRGPRPEHHRAPFHPVIICDRKRIAEWEAGWTGDGATMWVKNGQWCSVKSEGGGWLITKWQGLDINYGHLVRGGNLPDGTALGFWRDYEDEHSVKGLFAGAVWWSEKPMPEWLNNLGVIYPPDKFTQQTILDDVANDGSSGFGRQVPKFWAAPVESSR